MEEKQVLTDRELLEELARYARKRLLHARIVTAVLLAALVLLGTALFAPNGLMNRANAMLEHAETSLRDLDALAASARTILKDDAGAMEDALDKLGELDVEKFNEAAANLADASRPLAALNNLFSH